MDFSFVRESAVKNIPACRVVLAVLAGTAVLQATRVAQKTRHVVEVLGEVVVVV